MNRPSQSQRGYAAIVVAAMFAVLIMPLCALGVDTARIAVEGERVQRAADAGSLAGVPFMPDDLPAAAAAAVKVINQNGFQLGAVGCTGASCSATGATASVTIEPGNVATQLAVTLSNTISNTFAANFGTGHATVSRAATSDYSGAAPMGSPCNAFGNEPDGTTATGTEASLISVPAGGASCPRTPQFWAAVAGPNTPKENGDQVMTRTCSTSNNDGCSGTTNKDFDPDGYFYALHVAPAAVGQAVEIQLFDPAFVAVGDKCDGAPTATGGVNMKDWMNSYVTSDGISRYSMSSTSPFCTGDNDNSTTQDPIVTSFALRKPTTTYDPHKADPMTDTTGGNCVRQYPSYKPGTGGTAPTPPDATSETLAEKLAGGQPSSTGSANAKYKPLLARVFRQWVPMCTFTPTEAGDYYLQVRTNVALNTANPDGLGGYKGNSSVYTQTSDNTAVTGSGNNRFAVRLKTAAAGSVSIAGWNHMSIYVNYSGSSPTFNLVRVVGAAASKSIAIGFYDMGDASAPGTIQILPPTDSNLGGTVSGCDFVGVPAASPTSSSTCTISNVYKDAGTANSWQGKFVQINVPVPASYTCNSDQAGGCWYRVKMTWSSAPTDTTTWTANIVGDPVRLIK